MANESLELDSSAENQLLSESVESVEVIDAEKTALLARSKEMEEEAEKLKQLQAEYAAQMVDRDSPESASGSSKWSPPPVVTAEEKAEIDARSIYVGNVDYGATAEELEKHFFGCGVILRVNIMCNKINSQPKGYAYMEFGAKEFAETALAMNDTLFRGRQIKVNLKRTNRPGLCTTNRFPRGSRGRGRGRGITRGSFCCGHRGSTRRPSRGGYRGRGGFYAPY